MSTGFVKRVSGDYAIETVSPDGSTTTEVSINADTIRVVGDLIVTGETTEAASSDLVVSDNTITLNSGETGSGVTIGSAGINVDRGSANDVGIRFNETTDKWQITNDGTTWNDILSSGGGSGLENVVEDTTPELGGNLDVNGQQIVSASNGDIVLAPDGTGTVKIESTELAFDRLTTDPTAQADYNLLYHKTEGSGGTGLYFKTNSTSDELVSKSKAIVYGIIF
jgi:hypothetical protein